MNEQRVLEKVPTGLYIAGEWRDASGGATTEVEDPATGETLASVASATADDGRAALDDAVARGTRRYELLARAVLGEVDALADLERVAGLEAWWVTAELAARRGDDRLWRDAERMAGMLVAGVVLALIGLAVGRAL